MALDYGKKRVGVAVTDPLQIIATNLKTIPTPEIWDFLDHYFRLETVDCVVIGYPLQMNNKPSEAVKYIKPFIRSFKKKYPDKRLDLADERFTSQMAFQTMIDAGISKKARQDKALVDSISATIILQSYMKQKK